MRHTFKEFIDRYYMLSEGLVRSQLDTHELKNAAVKIAKSLLGNADWQIGKTKIFLKVGLKALKARPFLAHAQKYWSLALEKELYSVCKFKLTFFFFVNWLKIFLCPSISGQPSLIRCRSAKVDSAFRPSEVDGVTRWLVLLNYRKPLRVSVGLGGMVLGGEWDLNHRPSSGFYRLRYQDVL